MRRRGQGILDAVVIFIVIVAALLLMARYIRNALSGKFREAADSFGRGEVFEPK